MRELIRQRSTAVWVLLVFGTLLSYALGSDHGSGQRLAASAVLGIACLKAWLVGRHFMELRDAPVALRTAFDLYVVVLLAVLTGMYVAA